MTTTMLKVCGIPINVIGLTGGPSEENLQWLTGDPLGDVQHATPQNAPVHGVYGQYRWMNAAWTLQTVPFDRAPPGWFGYLIEYPIEEAE